MHAALVRVSIPGGVNDERLANLNDNVVPMVSGSPGFVAGYWGEVVNDEGIAYVVFEDEAAAKASAPPVGADMGAGVTVKSVDFHEVLANA